MQVPISLLLSDLGRTRASEVASIVGGLGFTVTGIGRATVSARGDAELVRLHFGGAVAEVEPAPPAGGEGSVFDFGAPAGFADEQLEVPEALTELVRAVAIAGPARRLR